MVFAGWGCVLRCFGCVLLWVLVVWFAGFGCVFGCWVVLLAGCGLCGFGLWFVSVWVVFVQVGLKVLFEGYGNLTFQPCDGMQRASSTGIIRTCLETQGRHRAKTFEIHRNKHSEKRVRTAETAHMLQTAQTVMNCYQLLHNYINCYRHA